jgi:hypothetical protein
MPAAEETRGDHRQQPERRTVGQGDGPELIGRPLGDALRLETIYGYSSLGDFSEAPARKILQE